MTSTRAAAVSSIVLPTNPPPAAAPRNTGFSDLIGSLIGEAPQAPGLPLASAPQSAFSKSALLPSLIPDSLEANQPEPASSTTAPSKQDKKGIASFADSSEGPSEPASRASEKINEGAQPVPLLLAAQISLEPLPFQFTITKPITAQPEDAPVRKSAGQETPGNPDSGIPIFGLLSSAGAPAPIQLLQPEAEKVAPRKPSDHEAAAKLTVPTSDSTQAKPAIDLAFAARLLPVPPKTITASEAGTDSKRRSGETVPAVSIQSAKTTALEANNPEPIQPVLPASDASHKEKPPASERKGETTDFVSALNPETPAALRTLSFTAAALAPSHASNAAQEPRPSVAAPPEAAPKMPDLPEVALPRSEPARDISLRFSSGTPDSVEVKLVERAGEVHLAVRSSNAELTSSLQAGVSELSGKLERSGFQTESWIPDRSAPAPNTQSQNSGDPSQQRRAPLYELQQSRNKKSGQPGWLQEMGDTFETLRTN